MPSSQAAGTDRRNERMITHEPPKLKTTLKTPPKQATNPLQFVKVGPCSLYRTAQEQLQKVQEVKKIKQEIRDDPEDWQSNLDNWKSSRRKRQEHIIERVVEVKKLELEEHDRQRRRSKTFSEMMEERGNRGRKLSISLAMYHEEDANDLSDLGIGTSSGKSSISGDTHDSHDDMHSVLSDKDSEIEKNHSDVEQISGTRMNNETSTAMTTTATTGFTETITSSASTTITTASTITTTTKNQPFGNGYGNHEQEYDSAITATASSPEPEEYTYEGAIRGYVSRVSQNIPRRTLAGLDAKLEESKASADEESKSSGAPAAVKIDIVKRREIFEKASQRSSAEGKLSNRLSGDFTGAKSIKERLSSLEKQKQQESNEKLEKTEKNGQSMNRLSGDMSTIRERLSHLEKERSERENRVSARRKISGGAAAVASTGQDTKHNDEMTARSIKDRLTVLDVARGKENGQEKRPPVGKHSLCYRDHEMRVDASTPSERSSSPDSEYRVSRAAFHRSLDSLDADASSGPDTFERVQSLEELDYARRYPASSSSAELLNDTDREDSGIHTADVSCSVSQADEPVDEDIVHALVERRHQEVIYEEKPFVREKKDTNRSAPEEHVPETNDVAAPNKNESFAGQREANVVTNKGTTETSSSGELTTNKAYAQTHSLVEASSNPTTRQSYSTSNRPVVYQSPKVPPRRTPPETPPKPKLAFVGTETAKLPSFKESLAGFQMDNSQGIADVETVGSLDSSGFGEIHDSTTAEREKKSTPLWTTQLVDVERENSHEISKPNSPTSKEAVKEDPGDSSSLEKPEFPANDDDEEERDEDTRIEPTISAAEVGSFVGDASSCLDLFVNNVSSASPASPTCTFVPASLSFYSSSSAAVAEAPSPISSSDSTCTVQEITKASPPLQTAGRSASKIPTPLQRKGSNGKSAPTTSIASSNSPTTSTSVPRTLSPKTRPLLLTEKRAVCQNGNLHGPPKLSEIPIFIGSNVTAHLSLTNSPEVAEVSALKPSCAIVSSNLIDASPKSPSPQSSPSSSPNLSKSGQGPVVPLHVSSKNHQASSIPTLTYSKKPQGMSPNFSKDFPESSIPSANALTIGQSPPTVPSSSLATEASETAEPIEKRRTVVEVCTKVVVPRGETLPVAPVTPFITVERVGDERDDAEEQDTTAKVIGEEVATICQVNVPVQPAGEFEMVENVETGPSEPTKSIEEKYSTVHDVSAALSSTTTSTTSAVPMTFERLPVSDNYTAKETGTMDNAVTVVSELTDVRESSTPMLKQIPPLILSTDEEILADIVFPLGPPTSIEPPKEKPPPPPVDLSDEENHPVEPLKRLNSTRRLKKELRSRRSDFLGLEGVNDDDLERELSVAKPPDMAAILAEERRVEHLHRHSYDTDSNYEQDSSHERDSGVELGHAEDWTKQPVSPDMSQHSRQSSEPFGASVTSSEEDEITKKEREIIEVLEKEEQWRYGNDRDLDSELGEKLAHKLRELEVEKMQLERERAHVAVLRHHEETFRKNADNARTQDETKCKQPEEMARVKAAETKHEDREIDEELRIQAEQLRIQNDVQENHRRTADARRNDDICNRPTTNHVHEQEKKTFIDANLNEHDEEFVSGEVLRVERELLQLEQEELKRQRTNLAYREQKQMQLEENLQEQWKSLQDVAHCSVNNVQRYKSQPVINYRSSMPNLQLQDGYRRRAPPPPIPPAKPLRLVDQQHRDVTVRNSRIPSADSIPQQVDDTSLRYSASTTSLSCHVGHQMSRQTLQALSAVPRTRIVQSDQWVQRRRSEIPRGAQDYNYQHWLVQEAEQRRINEKNQRTPARKQQHMTGTSVPYTTVPAKSDSKPLPDSIIQTLTQRVQNRVQEKPVPLRKRLEHSTSQEHLSPIQQQQQQQQQKAQRPTATSNHDNQEKMLSVSGKKKCSHCGDELGRGAAMIIESLRLFYHMECFKCCVCHVRLGDGLMGTDVRVRNHKLHCHNCYSSDDGVKFSCV